MTSAMLPPARIAGGLVELTPDKMADGRADAHCGELLAIDGVYSALAGFIERVEGVETLPIGQCCGRVTASSTLSAIPLPRFDHSAVDGFGIGVEALDCTAGTSVHVIDRVAAGARAPSGRLAAGSGIFLSTGAPIPFGVEAVVMEEKTVPDGSMVHLPACIAPGANIRRAGEDVPAGSVVVPIDVMLDSRHLAILAASDIPMSRFAVGSGLPFSLPVMNWRPRARLWTSLRYTTLTGPCSLPSPASRGPMS